MSNDETTAAPVSPIFIDDTIPEPTTQPPAKPKSPFADLKSDDLAATIAREYMPPLPDDGEVVIVRATASAKRAAGFRELRCYIYDYTSKQWFDYGRGMWTKDRLNVATISVATALNQTSVGGTVVFYIRVQPEDPNKPKRKCCIERYLDSELIAMLKLAPNNATFRSKLMSVISEMPPPELDTYDKLKDWLEFNFPKERPATPPAPERKLDIEYEGNVVERGTCKYVRRSRAGGRESFGEAQIARLIREYGTEQEVIDQIEEHIRSNYNTVESNVETSEESSDGDTDYDIGWNETRAREFIRQVARGMEDEAEYEEFLPEE